MVDRIIRERGQVGRRIWRRRRRRSQPTDSGAPAVDAGEVADDDAGCFDEEDVPDDDPIPPVAQPAAEKKGLFAALKGLFAEKQKPPEPSYLVVDPVREVLAVPRGAARLDAFERAIKNTAPGSPQFRSLALAFHKELQALADNAGVDLSLFETRVEACARALIAAGEEERAGTLFLRVGRRHQAAELFVAAGAIEQLEEAYAMINWDEHGPKHEARMSFERFEALFVVGMREQAFDALAKAHRLWHDNPVYAEIHKTFVERLGPPRRLSLTSGRNSVLIVGTWPVVIGRGEEAGVRLTSPLLSRAHLQVELDIERRPIVVDLDSRGGTRIAGAPLVGKQALADGAEIDMAGVVVKTRRVAGGLALHAALAPERRTVAATSSNVRVPAPHDLDGEAGLDIRFDGRGRAVLEPGAVANGEVLTKPLLLLAGDRVGTREWTWTVAQS